MNVLILAKDSDHFGGVLTATLSLATGLKKYKHVDYIIGTPINDKVESAFAGHNVERFNFSSKSPISLIQDYIRLCKVIKKKKIDIIHCQNRIPALYAAIYCFFHHKIKYLWVNHVDPIPSGFMYRLLTRYGYCAVADGISGKRMLEEKLRIPSDKIRLVNLGVDLSKFVRTSENEQKAQKAEYGIKDGEKVILLYGRLCEMKGHLFLMDALAKVKSRNFKLIFPGKDDEFKKLVDEKAEQYGLLENLIYPGFVNGQACLSICDLMILPSRHEGFPQACIEAYAVGVPVIRTMTGGYEDTADMCFGVEYGDIDALASLINDFFEDTTKYNERAVNASELVKRLSIERMVDDYYQLYEEAIKG